METLALLLLFPLTWPFVAKAIWKHEITLPEMLINVSAGVVVVVAGWYGGTYAQTLDHEILNGKVVAKTSEHVSCSHSYECMCTEACSGSGADRTCSRTCSTCYDHSYDVDWTLKTTVGDVDIDRVDRQGVEEPPRWTRAKLDDPVAKKSSFTNYIKAAPDSLFSAVKEQQAFARFNEHIPTYPLSVYDVHYVDRVLAVGMTVPDLAEWNRELALHLRDLGPLKQANVVVVLANQSDPEYASALRAAWLGGKKNDIVVVLGVPEYPKIGWARVISWTDQELFKVQLRDALVELGTAGRHEVLELVETHVREGFVRKPMKDFEYLANEIEPPLWLLMLLLGGSVAVSVGVSLYVAGNEHRVSGWGLSRHRHAPGLPAWPKWPKWPNRRRLPLKGSKSRSALHSMHKR